MAVHTRSALRTRAAAAAAAGLLAAACVAGCSSSSGQLNASSTCKQYLSKDAATRHDAAMRLSAQLHAEDPGNPMWGLNADYLCTNNQGATLRTVFGHPSAAPTDPVTDVPTDPPTDTPTPSISAPPADALGQVVLSADTISNVCSADGGGNGGNLTELLNHAVAILSCDTTPATLLGLDVATGAVLWTHPLTDTSTDPTTTDAAGASTAETVLPGPGSHVYLLDVTQVPATGLAAAYTTRTITALDEHSGDQSWTQPLEAEDRQDSGNGGTVLETPGPGDGATQVLVILDEYSSFDAATGKPLWRRATPDNQPTYVGYNLALSTAPSDTGDATNLTATNLATGKPAWSTALANGQSAVTSDSGSYTGQLAGHTYWTFAATGYDTFDVLTGKHTGHAVYPTAWTHTLATPTYIAAYVAGTLRLFHTGSWSRPVWSVSAAETTPVVMSDKALLVQADSGTLILDMADGSILQRDVTVDSSAGQSDLNDGLLPEGSDILELAPPS